MQAYNLVGLDLRLFDPTSRKDRFEESVGCPLAAFLLWQESVSVTLRG